MTIPKRFLKQLGKKSLSVFMAVLMILSTMSVCFGTFAPVVTVKAANGDGVQDFVDAALVHGKNYGFKEFTYGAGTEGSGNDKVITKTWTYKTGSYAEFKSLSNVITLMKKAAFNLDEYTKCKGHRGGSYCGDYYNRTCQENQCTDWVHVKNALVSLISNSDQKQLTNYGIDYLYNAAFNRNEIYTQTGDSDPGVCVPSGNGQDNGTTTSSSNLPKVMWNIVKVVPNDNAVKDVINDAATIADIPADIPTSFELKLGLARASQWKKEKDCENKTGDKYHLAIIEANAATEGPANKGSKTTNKSVLTDAQSTFSSAYFSTQNKNDVLAISSDETTLGNVLSDIKSKKSAVESTFGTDVYQKFFSTVPYAKTVKNIEDAITFLGFQAIIDEIDRIMAVDYSSYNSTELAGHLASLEEAYGEYKKLDDADKADILANYDFNPAEVEAKIAEINKAYTRLLVEEKLDVIEEHLATYENKWTMVDVDNDVLKYTTAYAAYLVVEQDYNSLKTLDKTVIAEIAGADFFSRVETLYLHLKNLATGAQYNELYTPEYKKFNSEVKSAVPSTDSANLLSGLKSYDSWYSSLRNLVDAMSANLSAEDAELLFDEMKDVMLDYMNTAYSILNGRVETQINLAYDLYTTHKEIYGPTVHYVSLESYEMVTAAIGNIEKEPYEFMKGTPNFNFSAETVAKYEELQELLLAYDKFAESMGFDSFYQVRMSDIEREDTIDDNFRQNTDKDDDGVGEYITTDAQIEKVIKVIDTALTNSDIAGALGLDLGTMLTDLLEGVIISDSFINTVVNLLYPLVLKEFGKVFANDLPKETSGCTVTYKYGLYDVFKDAGFNVYPDLLADQLANTKNHKNNKAYTEVITMLDAAYSEAKTKYPGVGGKGNDAYSTKDDPDNAGKLILDKTAWDSDALYETVLDDNGDPVIDETTGQAKKQLALKWGIDAAKEAGMKGDELKAYFYEVFDDAVEGLKPLLLALVANKAWDAPQVNNIAQADHNIIGKAADVHLQLDATANSGYANLLVPIYEALGLEYTPVSKIEGDYLTDTTKDVELIIGAILDPIFSLINKVGQAPLDTILGILPNLCYALEAGMVTPLLSMLKTTITYYAPLKLTALASMCADAEAPSGGVAIDVGTMLNIPILDDINRDGLNALLTLLGIEGLPEINQALVACLGELTQIETERKEAVYSSGNLASGKAYHVVADKADVLTYLAEYLLTAIGQEGVLDALMGLLGGKEEAPAEGEEGTTPEEGEATEEETSDLLTDILSNLTTNPRAAMAAIVELLNFNEYETQMLYDWFNGTNYEASTVLGFNPATEIYLSSDNDWTEAKADYLYDNLETVIDAVIAMIPEKEEAAEGEDANAPETVAEGEEVTEEVAEAKTLKSLLGDLIGGLYSDATLTALAAILGKLDLNALLAGDAEEVPAEGEETPETPETVAEGDEATEEEAALDINALINNLLGIDLGQFATLYGDIAEQYDATKDSKEPYVDHSFGVDAAADKKAKFVDELVNMLAPLNKVLDFLFAGGDLTIFDGDAKVTLYGSDGYNTAVIPLLEALGCTPVAASTGSDALKATLNALIARIDAITAEDANAVEEIFDILPGLVYFLTSNGLSTAAQNLLKPALVVIETIRPIIDVMDLLNNLEVQKAKTEVNEAGETVVVEEAKTLTDLLGGKLNLKALDANFVVDLVSGLLGLNLTGLKAIFYDVAGALKVETYNSASTLHQTVWKTATYSDAFSQGDLLTVLLSYVLEWVAVPENGAAIDKLAKKEGIGEAIANIIKGVEFAYGTPDWMYWFKIGEDADGNAIYDEAKLAKYFATGASLPNTLASLSYANDWDEETATFLAKNLDDIVDLVIGMVSENDSLAGLLNGLINENINAETLNSLVGMIAGLLESVDANLLAFAGYLLSGDNGAIDIVGLKNYRCKAEINNLSDFINELANVLDTYAGRLVNWLFFGKDFKFAKKSDNTDSLVIKGGLGYETGLALILEALGCELPATATTKSVLGALATRVKAILDNPVEEIIGLLPNLVYFLNANGAGVAINNILAPVNGLITEINAFLEKPISISDLIKIKIYEKDAEGNILKDAEGKDIVDKEIALDLANLSLANVVELLETLLPELDFTAVEDYLVNFCTGKIEKGTYIYKMTAPEKDVVTLVLTLALMFVKSGDNGAKLDEMLKLETPIVSALDDVFASTPVKYMAPEWYALDWDTVDYEKMSVGVVQSALTYPNDWTAEKSLYLADNLSAIVDTVIRMIEINGTKYESLAALIDANVNIYTPDFFVMIQEALGGLLNDLLKDDIKTIVEDYGFKVADSLLDADIQGLLEYDASGVNDKASFVAALTGMLMEVEGIVDWLLFGEDYAFFLDKDGNDIITLNGAEGYAQGLSLILEALGVAAPAVVKDENGVVDTEATVSAVLTAAFNRVDAVLADPVKEVINMLPNVIYFINANGLAAAVNNLAGAFNALALKLKAFNLNITLKDLVNIESLLKIEKDLAISLDNLTLAAVLELVAELTGLDLTNVADIFVGFALGRVQGYTGVNGELNAKMVYDEGEAGRFNKGDMMTLIVTAALRVIDNKNNAAVLDELIGSEIISALETVFAGGSVTYSEINWNYAADDDGEYMLKYPNNWNEETAIAVTDVLLNGDIQALIAGLIDKNYDTLGDLLTDKVNVFTSDNLQAVVDFIANLLKDIDDGLLKAAGVLLGANVVGLKSYKAPAGITTVKAFAAELANVLTTYAPGVVEWLLLGRDYKFFVKDDANGITVDAITIKGANGYTEGLAVLLEALGVAAPAVVVENGEVNTEATIKAVLGAVADRIEAIFANPVEEVINLLPNIIYFLNTDGVAAVIDNTIAAITALLGKLESFGLKLDINELVNLPKLMGVEGKYAADDDVISLDNITISSLLTAVSYMIEDLDLTVIKDVLVGFNLGKIAEYDSVSTKVGTPKKMGYYVDEEKGEAFERHDAVTLVANLLLITIADEDNAEFLKELMGEEIYGMIMELFDMTMVDIQEFSWMYTSKETGGNKVGKTFTTLETSEEYEDWPMYGPFYTEEMATYIAENFGMFVDNILYLLGLEINGITVDNLTDLINGLLDGNLYTAANVEKIRDALAGILANIGTLEVNGKVVGNHIIAVLKAAEVADLEAVGKVKVAFVTGDDAPSEREQFVAALCDVLEPLYPVLKYLLANEDFSFFVDEEGKDLITLKGANGYAYGILPLLEALECKNILSAKAVVDDEGKVVGYEGTYFDAIKAGDDDNDTIITSILNPLLDRVDEIIADPANEILEILPNIIYFINSNGVDTVVKNTLNAVYSLLKVIEPIAKIDLYELIGINFTTITMDWLLDKAVELLVNAGYAFTREDLNPILELTVGKLEGYTSLNGKQAYRMVYATSDVEGEVVSGGKEELVSIILRLGISFLMHENNADVLVDLLVKKLGMDPDAETYVRRLVKSIAAVPTTTYLGMNQAQAVVYYLFYSADIGAGEIVGGFKDIGAEWKIVLKELGKSDDPNEQTIGNILAGLFEEDIVDENRFAPSGLIGFFKKIVDWFNMIIEWFKNLF